MNTESENTEVSTPDTVESQAPVVQKDTKSIKIFVGVVAIVAVVIGIMYYMGPNLAAPKPVASNATVSSIDPETVLAIVNGEEIKQEAINARLQEAAQVLSSQGIDLTNPEVRAQIESQVLEDTISYTLLKKNAEEAGTQVTQDEIDATYEGYITQSGGEEQLIAQLAQIQLTPEEFRQRLQEQLTLDAYISENVDVDGISIADEEVQVFYDKAVATAGDAAPALADVRTQIVEQLTGQKKQELIKVFTDSLRENADIELK